MGSNLSSILCGDVTVTADEVEDPDTIEKDLSTATGLPTVITSISDRGDGGDSKWSPVPPLADPPSPLTSEGLPVLGSIHVVTY